MPAALRGAATQVSSSALIDALHAASLVGAVVAAAGAVLAVAYLGGGSVNAAREVAAAAVHIDPAAPPERAQTVLAPLVELPAR